MKKGLLLIGLLMVMGLASGQSLSSITDARDDIEYDIVTIGDQTWMAENLKYYTATFSKVYNNDSIEYYDDYGRLYQQFVADTICPSGYSLPTDSDWLELEVYLGMTGSSSVGYRDGGSVGKLLKSDYDSRYWSSDGGLDSYNFSALPAGYVKNGSFASIGNSAFFWTSSEDDTNVYYYRAIYRGLDGVERGSRSSSYYMSVRCIKD